MASETYYGLVFGQPVEDEVASETYYGLVFGHE